MRGEYVRHAIALTPQKHTWDIVCGVRDPVSRCVSATFQGGERYGWFDESDEDGEIRFLTNKVSERFALGRAGLDWFSAELENVTGIDVYATPFDQVRGYQVYEKGRFRVLLIRFEDLERVGSAALAEFFDLGVAPEIQKTNIGAAKSYARRYRAFLDRAQIPAATLDDAYTSPLATHFYSADELTHFRSQWAGIQ